MGLSDDQTVDVETVVVVRIGDGRLEQLENISRRTLARKLEFSHRLFDLMAADELSQQVQLLRADASHLQNRARFIGGLLRRSLGLAHLTSSSLSCPRRDRSRSAWERIRPACDPPSLRSH